MSSNPMRGALAAFTLSLAGVAPLGAQGTMRELYCRGAAGMRMSVELDPSPRDPRFVVMVLEYKRPSTQPGPSLLKLEPGTCTWNMLGLPGVPPEPGRVRVEVWRESQPWSATETRRMDTTARAGAFFPDKITLPRYLQDPDHLWKFFVDVSTNLSISFGAYGETGTPTYSLITGPVALGNEVQRDLICRGGSAGLTFGARTAAGNNLVKLVLDYRVSASVPGPGGLALSPGSCAWTDRTATPPEPGRIAFVTAGNAQIKQAQSGSTVDRSPTAAERWPDATTIPEYLKDPTHYWKFTAMTRAPDSALTNGVWKRDLTDVVAKGRSASTPTARSQPGTSGPGRRVFQPGGAGSTSSAQVAFDIKNIQVTPGLDGVSIRFDAAPDVRPGAWLSNEKPTRVGEGLQVSSSATLFELKTSAVKPNGMMMNYVAVPTTPLERDTEYWYFLNNSAGANARYNTKFGSFRTLKQSVTVTLTHLTVISDGDPDDDGELTFAVASCPEIFSITRANADLGLGTLTQERRYTIPNGVLTSQGSAPDRFRLLVRAYDDDRTTASFNRQPEFPPCGTGAFDIPPGSNSDGEWTSVALDFDLSKYPGLTGGDTFIRRSPLSRSSRVVIEIRGGFQFTRQ